MREKWKIIYYTTSSGVSPVYEFIESLDAIDIAKVHNALELLVEYNLNIGVPHIKKLTGTSLWELRILGTNNLRIFYVAVKEKSFLLLHGFKKKKQKTDRKEIRIALERLDIYKLWKSN